MPKVRKQPLDVPYQLPSGAWAVYSLCADGEIRRFVTPAKWHERTARRPVRLRFDVLARDNYTCQYCGRKAPDVELHVDHLIPVADGGLDEPANLVTACEECNAGKGPRHSGGIVTPRVDLYVSMEQRKRDAMQALYQAIDPDGYTSRHIEPEYRSVDAQEHDA